jgi:hypothetical protein
MIKFGYGKQLEGTVHCCSSCKGYLIYRTNTLFLRKRTLVSKVLKAQLVTMAEDSDEDVRYFSAVSNGSCESHSNLLN